MKRSKLFILMMFTCLVSFGQITKQDTTLLTDWTFDSDTTVTIDFSQFNYEWNMEVWYKTVSGTKDATVGVYSSNTINKGFVVYDTGFEETLSSAADTLQFESNTFNGKWMRLKCVQNSMTSCVVTAKLTRVKVR